MISLFCICEIKSQTIVNVIYRFEYLRDLKDTNHAVKDSMILTTNNKSSRYCSLDTYKRYITSISNEKDNIALSNNVKQNTNSEKSKQIVVTGRMGFQVKNYGSILNEEIDKDFTKNTLDVYSQITNKAFNIADKLIPPIWKITEEKLNVYGYNCQKAVGKIGGRVYIVWFTPELPFHDGPWKLNGLPGLILQAVDTKNQIRFDFVRIMKNNNSVDNKISSIINSDRCQTINSAEYEKLLRQYATDPMAMAQGFNPGAGKIMVVNVDSHDNTIYKVQSYNPMTL